MGGTISRLASGAFSEDDIMKSTAALAASACVVFAAWLAPSPRSDTKSVSVTLVDRESGTAIFGVVRFQMPDGSFVVPQGSISRGWGLERTAPIGNWVVVPPKTSFELPIGKLV